MTLGDCLAVMAVMEAESVDAVVTDPPYGLEFMGKEWDRLGGDVIQDPLSVGGFQDGRGGNPYSRSRIRYGVGEAAEEWHRKWALAALRVAKPGAHLLAFGGTRTWHRLACAVEDAGWEIRDCLCWLYGSGFPKSLDVAKALDVEQGFIRGRRGDLKSFNTSMSGPNYERTPKGDPVSAIATTWNGWGTALKPAWEPIIMARKPLVGTVAQNVARHGTGGLNVDGCRLAVSSDDLEGVRTSTRGPTRHILCVPQAHGEPVEYHALGRWPANLVLDPEAAALLDAQAGERRSAGLYPSDSVGTGNGVTYGRFKPQGQLYADSGGPSRFFYCAKASRAEREAGCEHLPARDGGVGALRDGGRSRQIFNVHPTVKPVSLMRWLCRLVTPPGGLILDPFAGSGSTGCAAVLEGFRFEGIEKDPDYLAIAEARIQAARDRPWLFDPEEDEPEPVPEGQLTLFEEDRQ